MPAQSLHLADQRRPSRSRKSAGKPSNSSFKMGRVCGYLTGRIWYIRYYEKGRRIQRRAGTSRSETKQLAAEINSQVECGAPSAFGFEPCRIDDLRIRWLDHHEDIKRSSLATIARYRAATAHIIRFAEKHSLRNPSDFTGKTVEQFVRHLRSFKVSANGHHHSAKRFLRDSGVKYILQTCSNLFNYAKRHRHLPPYSENPFLAIEIGHIPIEDAREIAVFSRYEECQMPEQCSTWQFPIMLTLLQTGRRPQELDHTPDLLPQ